MTIEKKQYSEESRRFNVTLKTHITKLYILSTPTFQQLCVLLLQYFLSMLFNIVAFNFSVELIASFFACLTKICLN